MQRRSFLLVVLALALPAVARADLAGPAGTITLSRRVPLREGPVELRVRCDANHRDWAAYQLDRAAAFLPQAERFLDVPFRRAAAVFFPRPAPAIPRVLIVGRGQVLLNGAWIGAYNNTAGFFPGERGIFVEYRLTPPGNPALVLHELGHFWLHDRARVTQASAADVGAPWFNEGAASLLPLTLLQAGLLPLTPAEAAAIGVHWGLGDVPLRVDAPIEEDLRPRGGAHLLLFYQKSFLSQILLARAVGSARYRGLLHAVAQDIEQIHDTGELMALLGPQVPGGSAALRPLLRGWVFAGAYGPLSPDVFRGARVAPDGTPRLPAAPAPDAARGGAHE